MSRWRFAILSAFFISCEFGTDPARMDGFEFCGSGESALGHRSIYDAHDSLIRYQTYGSDGKMFYEYTYQYAGVHLVAQIGRGFPPGPGRENTDTHYSYEEVGNRLQVREEADGRITLICRDRVHDTAARVIRFYACGSDQPLSLRVLDSLERPTSDTSYSGEGIVSAIQTFAYDDSGWVQSHFSIVGGAGVLDWTRSYDTRGRPRSVWRESLERGLWQTQDYTRVGSRETYEIIREDGIRLERGYSDLSPTGKPLKTIRCFSQSGP